MNSRSLPKKKRARHGFPYQMELNFYKDDPIDTSWARAFILNNAEAIAMRGRNRNYAQAVKLWVYKLKVLV